MYNDYKKFESYSPEFRKWDDWYNDLFREQREIRNIGTMLLLDLNNKEYSLQLYYSRIVNLFSTHRHYIDFPDLVDKKLEEMETFLFSDKYMDSKKKNRLSVKESEIKILKVLRKIFTKMCEDFSKKGLSVKVEMTQKAKLSDLEDDEHKKEELKNLEKLGLV
jgi:hypothetical protein